MAMKQEIDSFEKCSAWELVRKPNNTKIIKSKVTKKITI